MAGLPPYLIDIADEDAIDVVKAGYVRVMFDKRSALYQIREDIIQQSQVMAFLASARDSGNSSECIHLANDFAVEKNVLPILDWLDIHSNFVSRNASVAERLEFDRYHFLLNDLGTIMYKELKRINVPVHSAIPSDTTLTTHLRCNIQFKIDKLIKNNKTQAEAFKITQAKAYKIVLDEELDNILDPYNVYSRSNYHKDINSLVELSKVVAFLELHPSDWHTNIAAAFVENANTLQALYPGSQFGYFNIPQRIVFDNCYEILMFHIAYYYAATATATPVKDFRHVSDLPNEIQKYSEPKNLTSEEKIAIEQEISLEKDTFLRKNLTILKILGTPTFAGSVMKQDLFNVVVEYNYFNNEILKPKSPIFANFALIPTPRILKYKTSNTTNAYLNYLNFVTDNYISVDKATKALEFLFIILAYHSSEGNNQKVYRNAYMDNPDPNKKYIRGDTTRPVTDDTPAEDKTYTDEFNETQYRGLIVESLIQRWMP